MSWVYSCHVHIGGVNSYYAQMTFFFFAVRGIWCSDQTFYCYVPCDWCQGCEFNSPFGRKYFVTFIFKDNIAILILNFKKICWSESHPCHWLSLSESSPKRYVFLPFVVSEYRKELLLSDSPAWLDRPVTWQVHYSCGKCWKNNSINGYCQSLRGEILFKDNYFFHLKLVYKLDFIHANDMTIDHQWADFVMAWLP